MGLFQRNLVSNIGGKCSNNNPRLAFSCLTAMPNFATLAFILENVIMMDSLEIVAACDLEVGLCSKLNK